MNVRESALDLLLRCEAAGQYANLALDNALKRESGITGADKGLFTALFYGVIEHRITLDHIINTLSSIPPSSIEKKVRMILRMGLCQLLYFDRIPDHAAINESVSLAPSRSRGFVNALLRAFCRNGKCVGYPNADEAPLDYLSVRYSVPVELAEAFVLDYGFDRAERLLAAFDRTPAVSVRVNTLRYTRDEFVARYGGESCKTAPNGVRFASAADILDAVRAGDCFVQDEASQICVAATGVAPDQRVADLCAAPGSKSFGMALQMQNTGALHSFDLHENKVSLIRRGAEALGLTNVTAAAADARIASPQKLGEFDTVLVDVPCSGYGVLSKKPDIRYKDFELSGGLPPIQSAILDAAATCVKKGGTLVYSTCTLLKAENERQIEKFLARHPEFSLQPFTVGDLCSDGMLTLAPDTHETDGFFIAKLQKG